MAKIIRTRKLKPFIPQTIAALILICLIVTAESDASEFYKVCIYFVCFVLIFKTIESCIKGQKQEVNIQDWISDRIKEKVKQDTLLYELVKKFVIEEQKASESLFQRTFDIDYETATNIMDKLEKEGVVGTFVEGKPRKVLIKNMKET